MPALLTAVLLVLSGTPAPEAAVAIPRSDAPVAPAPSSGVYELRHNWLVDGSITGVAAVLELTSDSVFKKQLAPSECRLWCETTTTLNPLDRWGRGARWSQPSLAARLS